MPIDLPPIREIIVFTPIFFIALLIIGSISGYLKKYYKIQTGLTRKICHILVFTCAAFTALYFGFSYAILFGMVVGVYTIIIIMFNEGNLLFEGVAREEDAPFRALYLVIPYMSTALASYFTYEVFARYAAIGYIVTGWGDSMGEILGKLFGKHKYKVPFFNQDGKSYRSVEGSLGVFMGSAIGVIVALWWFFDYSLLRMVVTAFGAAAAVTIVEAISPHGTDNFTTQLTGTVVSFIILNNPLI